MRGVSNALVKMESSGMLMNDCILDMQTKKPLPAIAEAKNELYTKHLIAQDSNTGSFFDALN